MRLQNLALTQLVLGNRRRRSGHRRAIVLDTSYSWDEMCSRGTTSALTTRDLNGFFDRVWSVHPFPESALASRTSPRVVQVDRIHTIIEGGVSLSDSRGLVDAGRFGLAQVRLLCALLRVGWRNDITIVRAGDPYYLGILALLLSRVLRVPFTVRVAGNFDESRGITGRAMMPRLFPNIPSEKWVEHFILRRATWVTAPNDDNLEFARRNGARTDRSSVVRYGTLLAPQFWSSHDRNPPDSLTDPTPPGRDFLLVVSRLEPVKQVEDAIRAFGLIADAFPHLELWIAGDGSQLDELKALANSLSVSSRVLFLGTKDQDWLAAAYKACRAFIAPQAGRALSEAALSGALVIGYDRDWQRELILDNTCGLLVEAGNWKSLGEATMSALKDTAGASRMRRGLRSRAAEMLSPESCLAAEQAVCRAVMGAK